MKKIKLKLNYDELSAIYGDLFNNVGSIKNASYQHRLLTATLTELYMKIAPKVLFRTGAKITISLTVAHASALYMHVHNYTRNPADYVANVLLKVAQIIDQQLS